MHAQILKLAVCLSITTVFIIGCGDSTPPSKVVARGRSKEEERAKIRRDRIHEEITELGIHDWAGDYYTGDGLGFNRSLVLAPKSGYVHEQYGCLGVYDRNYGAVDFQGDQPKLTFLVGNVRTAETLMTSELILVRWGKRRYLVSDEELIKFCNEVNLGEEPRSDSFGSYLLRQGDEQKKVVGLPVIPLKFRDYLLSYPIDAIVLSVGLSTLKPLTEKYNYRETELTVDKGAKQGLKIGMELITTEPKRAWGRIRITNVQSDQSEGVMTQNLENGPMPMAGWRLSTRNPRNAEKPD